MRDVPMLRGFKRARVTLRRVWYVAYFELGPLDGYETSLEVDPGDRIWGGWLGYRWHKYMLDRKIETGVAGGGTSTYLVYRDVGASAAPLRSSILGVGEGTEREA